jgi:hypothetical protein
LDPAETEASNADPINSTVTASFTHLYHHHHNQPSPTDLPPSNLRHICLKPKVLFRTDATPMIQPANQILMMIPFEHSETDSHLPSRHPPHQAQPSTSPAFVLVPPLALNRLVRPAQLESAGTFQSNIISFVRVQTFDKE